MAIPHHGMSRGVWGVFITGIIATITYSFLLLILIIFPSILSPAALMWFAEVWGDIGAIYIVSQILPILTRPVTRDAWEITDGMSSYIPAAIVVLVFPVAWFIRGEWPNWWTARIAQNAFWISLGDVLLTHIALKISRNASRITSA